MERVTNENIAQLHNYVSSVRDSAEVQSDYMTLGEWIDWNVEELTEARVAEKMKCITQEYERFIVENRERGLAEGRERGLVEGRERGLAEGRKSILLDTLADLGVVPDEVQARLQDIDEDTLKQWIKLAARADSMEAFLQQI